jgi:hypothetical protein
MDADTNRHLERELRIVESTGVLWNSIMTSFNQILQCGGGESIPVD